MLTAQDGNMGVTKNHLGLLTFYLGDSQQPRASSPPLPPVLQTGHLRAFAQGHGPQYSALLWPR